MAIIGEIRKRPVLILVIIGLSLIAFVLADTLSGVGRGSEQADKNIMLNGEPIDQANQAFINDLGDMNKIDLRNIGGSGQTNAVDNALSDKLAWRQFAEMYMIEQQAEMIGLNVNEDEVEQLFYDGDTNMVATYMSSFRFIDAPGENENIATWLDYGKSRYDNKLRQFEVRKMRLRDKYFSLLRSGLYVTHKEAERHYNLNNTVKKVKYIYKAFNAPDLTATDYNVSDADVKAYFNENRNNSKYRQPKGKSVQVAEIMVPATEEDAKMLFTDLENNVKDRFLKSIDDSLFAVRQKASNLGRDIVIQADSATFVRQFSQKFYNDAFNQGDTTLVFGPFENQMGVNRTYRLIKTSVEYPIALKEIFISKDGRPVEEFNKLVDSLNTILRTDNDKFDDMIARFHEDTVNVSGMTGYMDFNAMKRNYGGQATRQAFNTDQGGLGSSLLANGYKVFKVVGFNKSDTAKFVLTSTIDKRILPTGKTINSYKKTQVMDLIQEGDVVGFKTMADSMKYIVKEVTYNDGDLQLQGYPTNVGLFEFVKNAPEGDASKGYATEDRILVAFVKRSFEDGPFNLEDNWDVVKNDFINTKKAEALKTKLASVTSVEQAAQMLGVTVQEKDVKFTDPSIAPGNSGSKEAMAVGAVYGHDQDGTLMKSPIVGENGIYLIQVVSTSAPVSTTDLTASESALQQRFENILGFTNTATENQIKDPQRNQQMVQFGQRAPLMTYMTYRGITKAGLYNALKTYSDIEDNR